MHTSLKGFPVAALLILTLATGWGQQELIDRVRRDLATQSQGGVFDYGHLLKPGGERELQQLVEQFRREGLRLWFVTLPGTLNPNGSAESLYADLSMREDDVLITFNGQGCYAKTLALKGEPEFFKEAFKQSSRSFHLYYAKGLGHFARLIKERIQQRRRAERVRHTTFVALLVAAVLGVTAAVSYRPLRWRIEARRHFREQLERAKAMLVQVTLKMSHDAPKDLREEVLRLDERLKQVEQGKTRSQQELDELLADLERLDSRLPGKEQGREAQEDE